MAVHGIEIPRGPIAALCRRLGVAELAIFGSALRDDFGPESDVDFLVTFKSADYGPWLSKINRLEDELSRLLGCRAEVVPKDSLKWVVRDRILEAAEIIYADEE